MWKLKRTLTEELKLESCGPICEQFACVRRSCRKDAAYHQMSGCEKEGTTRRDGNSLVLEVREEIPNESGNNGNSIGGDALGL